MSKDYAPLPFSYLTGGVAPEKKPTGFKKSTSDNDPGEGDGNNAPYSIYSGRTLDKQDPANRAKVVSMDVADPYLLSTGALNASDAKAAASSGSLIHGSGDPRNSYAEDPRYRDSIPSESDGGNVFFRSPDAKDTPKSQTQLLPVGESPSRGQVSDAGYVNQAHDGDYGQESDVGPTKKLPRFVVSEKGVYQYYTGQDNDGRQPDDRQTTNDLNKADNPIWDKYYATGGLQPGAYQEKKVSDGSSANVRPSTKVDDFNTLLRATSAETSDSSCCCCCCCGSKKSAVLCAIFITAIICLAIGFVCGWFIYQEYGSQLAGNGTTDGIVISSTTTPPTPLMTTTTQSTTTTTLAGSSNVTTSADEQLSNTTVT